jgi:hypothetical protein
MPYTILLSLDTVGASILNVDLYNCTGDTLGNVSGCTITGNTLTNYTLMSGYSNILKRDFPKYVIVPDGTYYIKAVPSNLNDGGCVLSEINPIRIQMPTTPTPTPTTTPTPTPSPTPIPTSTPTNTPNPCSFDANVVYGLPATLAPTAAPTNVPTSVPTNIPTNVPTNLPTNVPTNIPTNIPTDIPTATPTSLPPTPTPTPYRIVANDLWVGDPGDVEFGDNTSCTHTSPINAIYDGVDAWLYSATNICDATSVETDNALGFNWVSAEMSPDQYIWISQTGITYDSTLGNYVRLYKRSGSTNTLLPSGTCINCLSINEPTPTPTPIPQITVNIYGRQNTPYDAVSNNLQLVYQTYNTTLGPVNNTTSGIQKSIIEGETFLVSPSVDAGGYLNLGAFLRVTDSTCDYVEVNVNVFAAGAYLSSRFTNSAGSLLSDYGCGLQGSINGVSIPVSQAIDVYITPTSTGVCFGSALTPPGLECLNTGS